MITIVNRARFINYRVIFFSHQPFLKDCVNFVEYNQCKSTSEFIGFRRESFYTKVIDLTNKEDKIFGNFRKNTRYEINRAKKNGIKFEVESNLEEFVKLYNIFAGSKKLGTISLKHVRSYGSYLIITKASNNGYDLVMHAYLIDEQQKRVRLLHSASLYRYEQDVEKGNLIGMSNRFLHFADMLFFKGNKFQIYDLGGYDYKPKDERFIEINKFKDSFGGELVAESIYTSYPLFIYRLLTKLKAT